jgi:hypothetical protein
VDLCGKGFPILRIYAALARPDSIRQGQAGISGANSIIFDPQTSHYLVDLYHQPDLGLAA